MTRFERKLRMYALLQDAYVRVSQTTCILHTYVHTYVCSRNHTNMLSDNMCITSIICMCILYRLHMYAASRKRMFRVSRMCMVLVANNIRMYMASLTYICMFFLCVYVCVYVHIHYLGGSTVCIYIYIYMRMCVHMHYLGGVCSI